MKITQLLSALTQAKSAISAAFVVCFGLLLFAPAASFAQSADLQLTKSGPSSATGGGTFTYTLVMDNNGPNASHGATFIDTLPAGVSNVAMSCVSASAGAQCPTNLSVSNTSVSVTLPVFPNQAKVTIEVTGNFPATGPTSLTNTATITVPAGVSDPKPDSNTSAVSTSMSYVVDLSVIKTQSPAAYTSGVPVTYTVTIANSGPAAADGARISDFLRSYATGNYTNLVATFVSCTAGGGAQCPANSAFSNYSGVGAYDNYLYSTTVPRLPANGSLTIVYTLLPTDTVAPCGTGNGDIQNFAFVSPPSGVTDSNSNNNASSVALLKPAAPACPQVDLSVIKTQSPATYTSGVPVTYTVTVSNAGPNAANGAMIRDFMRTYGSGNYTNLVASFVSCTAAGGAQCPANSAFQNYSGVGAYDNYLYSTTIPQFPAGGSLTIVYTMTPTDVAAPCGTSNGDIQNFAFISAPAGTTDSSSNNDASSVALFKPAAAACPQADLSVTKTQSPENYVSGAPVTYTITFNNAGPSAANGTSISDFLRGYGQGNATNLVASFVSCTPGGGAQCPANSAFHNYSGVGAYDNYLYSTTVPQLPSGGSLTIIYTLVATDIAAPCSSGSGDIQNFASITPPAGVTDPEGGNNNRSVALLLSCADVSVNKSVAPVTTVSGGTVTYTIDVASAGPADTSNVAFSDPLPVGFNYSSASCSTLTAPATCGPVNFDSGTRTVSSSIASIGSQGAVRFLITGTAGSTPGTYPNTAYAVVAPGVVDPIQSSNSSTVNLQIVPSSTLTVVKTVNGGPAAGLPAAMTFTGVITCGAQAPQNWSVTVAAGATTGTATALRFIDGDTCSITENTPPTAPAGYTWSGAPSISPNPTTAIGPSAALTINVTNTLQATTSTLTVVKKVNGGPAAGLPAAMTFTGVITCGAQAPQSWSVTVAAGATTGTATALRFIDGDTCSITENTPPTAPAGYTWSGAPSISPNPTTAIGPSAALTINVTNTLQATTSTLTVVKKVNGGPAAGLPAAMTFTGVITCGAQAPQSWSVTVAAGATTGTATALRFIDGDTCSITENTPPTAPAGYTWSGAPSISPNPTTTIGPSAALTINVTNTLQATSSTLTVVKKVNGGPATGLPAAMTFTGVITCGAQAPQNWSVTVAAGATSGTGTALRFLDGDTCSITENTPSAAPDGYTWSGVPSISPNPTTAIGPSAALTINVTNTLVQQDTGGNPGVPAPVPSLNQWALMLLSIVLVGFAGADFRRARKTR